MFSHPASLPRRVAERGMSLVEVLIVSVISVSMMGTFALTVLDAADFTASTVTGADLQIIGRRALDRMSRDVAASGRTTDVASGVALPYVYSDGQCHAAFPAFTHDHSYFTTLVAQWPNDDTISAGSSPLPFVAPGDEWMSQGIREIVFRRPNDNDGDGSLVVRPGAAHAGELEWGTSLFGYVVLPNPKTGTLDLVRRTLASGGSVTDETICRHVESLTLDTSATKPILPLDAVEVHLHLKRVDTRGHVDRLHLATTLAMRNSLH